MGFSYDGEEEGENYLRTYPVRLPTVHGAVAVAANAVGARSALENTASFVAAITACRNVWIHRYYRTSDGAHMEEYPANYYHRVHHVFQGRGKHDEGWEHVPALSSPLNAAESLSAGKTHGASWMGYIALLRDGYPVFAEVGEEIELLPHAGAPPRVVSVAVEQAVIYNERWQPFAVLLAADGTVHVAELVDRVVTSRQVPLPRVEGHKAVVLSLCTSAVLAMGDRSIPSRVCRTRGLKRTRGMLIWKWKRRLGVNREQGS